MSMASVRRSGVPARSQVDPVLTAQLVGVAGIVERLTLKRLGMAR
jgi:hypothetical protein